MLTHAAYADVWGTSKVVVRGNTICHNDGANIAVLDNRCDVC
jgi:hypothetical protein